jgi:hypothetical protein
MNTYTAFCQQTNGKGTIWVSTFQALDVNEAIDLAIQECALDWEDLQTNVHCLGIADGDVNLLHWDDIEG